MTDTAPDAPATPQAPVTWALDTMMQTITVAGEEIPQHRVLVNNRRVAYLYNRGSGSPVRKLDEASFRDNGGRWVIEGTNPETGEHETWSAPKVKKRAGCSSCGGGRR